LELDGSCEEARAACCVHGFEPDGSRHGDTWGRLYRPVRVLARVAPPFTSGTTIEKAERRCGVRVAMIQPNTQRISAVEYAKLIGAIDWA
jgi:hypothetical protein